MYVACPSCKSLYSISAEQLTAAGGQVRCSQCQTLFNAVHAVFDDPQQALAYEHSLQPELVQEIDELVGRALGQVSTATEAGVPAEASDQSRTELPVSDTSPEPPRAHDRVEGAEPGAGFDVPVPVVLRADADHYAQPVAAEFVSPSGEDFDSFAVVHGLLSQDTPVPVARTSWGAIAASLLLSVSLVAQYTWWDRNRLAQISTLRPLLDWLCQPLDCELPLRHDLARVEMVEREVRDHPNVKDALLVSAAFINRASYPQAYPVLQIAFSDVSGTPVAVRRFMPEEYLHGKNPGQGMAAGEQTLVMLEVVDPGDRAVSFQFDFM